MAAELKHVARDALHRKLVQKFSEPVSVVLEEQDVGRAHLQDYLVTRFVMKCTNLNEARWKNEHQLPAEYFDKTFTTIIRDVELFAQDRHIIKSIDAVVDTVRDQLLGIVTMNVTVYVAYILAPDNHIQQAFNVIKHGLCGDAKLNITLVGGASELHDSPFSAGDEAATIVFPINIRDKGGFVNELPEDLQDLAMTAPGRMWSYDPDAHTTTVCSSIGAAVVELRRAIDRYRVPSVALTKQSVELFFIWSECRPDCPVRFCKVVMCITNFV